MSTDANLSGQNNQLNVTQQCDYMLKLAQDAHNRFDQRRSYEWKICFAVWTSLGTASGLALRSEKWNPPLWFVFVTMIISLFIFLVFVFSFSLWVHGAHARDKRIRDYWYQCLEELGRLSLPGKSGVPESPGHYIERRLTRMYAENYSPVGWFERLVRSCIPARSWELWRDILHPLNLGQISMTFLFALLLASAVYSKYEPVAPPAPSPEAQRT